MDTSREILLQINEFIAPLVVWTLQNESGDILGLCDFEPVIELTNRAELYDNVFEILDGLTFTLRTIPPSLWPAFELLYARFKSNATDFLDGLFCLYEYQLRILSACRDVAASGELYDLRRRCFRCAGRLSWHDRRHLHHGDVERPFRRQRPLQRRSSRRSADAHPSRSHGRRGLLSVVMLPTYISRSCPLFSPSLSSI